MKTVQDYLDLGLKFVDDDRLLGSTNNKDSKEVCMSGLCIAHKRYCEGFRGGNAIFFYPSEWTPSSFAWRNNDGVKPEYRGVIEVRLNNTIELIGIYSDRPLWSRGYLNSVSKWRPVVLQSDDAHENNDSSFTLPIGIDSPGLREAFKSLKEYLGKKPPFWNKSMSIFNCPCAKVNADESAKRFTIKEETPSRTMTVNIEGRDYLIPSRTPTVSPKEDKQMKPVYTAEMHAKGELPPVGAECILIVNDEPRPVKVTYIGKDIVCCSNVDGDAEYACLLGLVSFEPIPKTIKVNGFDVPAPMSEAPDYGSIFFKAEISNASEKFCDRYCWGGTLAGNVWLKRGIIHSNELAAIAHAKAMLGIDPNA